ncbi:uncharacterized protein LOC132402573 isoform X1 [Hypanus sabinus]|uniref:uncharacterized protein LOC132402573 isoform X1 n=1 Tax=Hypanus sabinus TaxID=79690 RepID=UPI0028C441C4|nr:uncharacterized protein LOC132402573 isoform X1 [Hypanus sabinus]XP_059841441.1 uncharacterized protein LOC132402573 isoform X1 [Hypanus sabinus]
MFAAIITTLTLSVCAVGVNAGTDLIQSPGVVKVREGGTVLIQCVLESDHVDVTVDKYHVHWYNSHNKLTRKGIVLSLYHNGRVYRSRGFSGRFQLSRNVTTNSYSLTIRKVRITDSKLYICGIWDLVFGNGTQLNVTSADVPALIQSPSIQRVTEGHTAWLWCTMSKARLEDIDVHWYRKLPGQDMEWVLTHRAGGSPEWGWGFTERFQSYRDTSNSTFTLTVTDVVHNDSAVYYCRVWGDIDGNSTQLIVTKADEGGSWKVLASILTSILVLVLLFFILVTAICCVKKWACFQQRLKPEGCSSEDGNIVYETVTAETEVDTQAATNVTASEQSEMFYADIQFQQQKTAPKIQVTEEATEYAVIKRTQ